MRRRSWLRLVDLDGYYRGLRWRTANLATAARPSSSERRRSGRFARSERRLVYKYTHVRVLCNHHNHQACPQVYTRVAFSDRSCHSARRAHLFFAFAALGTSHLLFLSSFHDSCLRCGELVQKCSLGHRLYINEQRHE